MEYINVSIIYKQKNKTEDGILKKPILVMWLLRRLWIKKNGEKNSCEKVFFFAKKYVNKIYTGW